MGGGGRIGRIGPNKCSACACACILVGGKRTKRPRQGRTKHKIPRSISHMPSMCECWYNSFIYPFSFFFSFLSVSPFQRRAEQGRAGQGTGVMAFSCFFILFIFIFYSHYLGAFLSNSLMHTWVLIRFYLVLLLLWKQPLAVCSIDGRGTGDGGWGMGDGEGLMGREEYARWDRNRDRKKKKHKPQKTTCRNEKSQKHIKLKERRKLNNEEVGSAYDRLDGTRGEVGGGGR